MRALAALLLVLLLSTTLPSRVRAQESPPDSEDESELEEFVPSEEVPADEAISFPVDI